ERWTTRSTSSSSGPTAGSTRYEARRHPGPSRTVILSSARERENISSKSRVDGCNVMESTPAIGCGSIEPSKEQQTDRGSIDSDEMAALPPQLVRGCDSHTVEKPFKYVSSSIYQWLLLSMMRTTLSVINGRERKTRCGGCLLSTAAKTGFRSSSV